MSNPTIKIAVFGDVLGHLRLMFQLCRHWHVQNAQFLDGILRIGVVAPRNCSIHRGEVWRALTHAGIPAPENLLGPDLPAGSPMLILSRKKNESIVIHGDVTITVVEIRDDKIRLGIQAPKHVSISRSEVYDALKRSQEKP